jgi:integrase
MCGSRKTTNSVLVCHSLCSSPRVFSRLKWDTREAKHLNVAEALRPKALSGAIRRFSAERGFDLPRFHGLSRTCAVLMLVSGTDVKTVASRLGHANPALLFSTYSHFIDSADQGAADKLDVLLDRSGR